MIWGGRCDGGDEDDVKCDSGPIYECIPGGGLLRWQETPDGPCIGKTRTAMTYVIAP